MSPPRLVAVDSVGSESPDRSLPAVPMRVPVTGLQLVFDQPVVASNADLRLLIAGPDGALQRTQCAGGVDDDVALPLGTLTLAPDATQVLLHVPRVEGLSAGTYRLLVCDSLHAMGGAALDGDGDGVAGGVARQDVTIGETPLLLNPDFRGDLSGWEFGSPVLPVPAVFATQDADDSSFSGSLRITLDAGEILAIGQADCFAVPALPGGTFAYRLRMRHRVLAGSVRVSATVGTAFAGDMGETCFGPGISAQHSIGISGPSEWSTWDTGLSTLPAFPNGKFFLSLIAVNGPAELLLDDLGLTADTERVFASGFD